MSDKTQLERQIELQEMERKPRGYFMLVALLLICLAVAGGAFALKFRHDLSIKEKELSLIKYNCDNEKAAFSNKIKELEAVGCGLQPATDKPHTSEEVEKPQ